MKLSPREKQVVELLLQGYSNPEMAKELGIAERTVKLIMNRLFIKAGLGDASGIKRVKLAVKLYRDGSWR